jgi:hypothetical protein
MPSPRAFPRWLLCVGALLMLALTSTARAAVAVTVNFNPAVIRFSPLDPPIYILGVGVNATGFTNDSNLNNYILLQSNDNAISGDFYPARGTGSGTAGSQAVSSAAELANFINARVNWTLTIVDGVTNQTRTYTLIVSTPGIPSDYVRPITLNDAPDTQITPTSTFQWDQDTAIIPGAEYTDAAAILFGTLPGNIIADPPIGIFDTQWQPTDPLLADSYTLLVTKRNSAPAQNLINATTPLPVGGAPSLASFTKTVTCQSDGQSGNLFIPAPAAGNVFATFEPYVISFSPNDPPVYILSMPITAKDFVDEDNINNFVKLAADNNAFSGDYYPARGTGSGTGGSQGYSSLALLTQAINSVPSWTLTLTDGTTNQTRTFRLDVTSPGIASEFVRPITFQGLQPGDEISSTPTFTFSQPSTSNPQAQNTDTFAFILADNGGFVDQPPLAPNGTSWTPGSSLVPDTYTVVIGKFNSAPPQSLIQTTTPVRLSGNANLTSFNKSVRCSSSAQVGGLRVVGCDTIDFNRDTLTPDSGDLDDFIAVLAGGPGACSNAPNCGDVDFNNDGLFPDSTDLDAFVSRLGGGPCVLP